MSQSNPGWHGGEIPSAAQWNALWSIKEDWANALPKDGSVAMTGLLTLSGNPVLPLQAATKQYVDSITPGGYVLPAATNSVLGGVMPDGTTITNIAGAISVTYGTSATTAAAGNDSRIVNAYPNTNPSGYQTAAQVVAVHLSSFNAPLADISMAGFKLVGLGTPSAATDAATKGYVDAFVTGLQVKAAVRVATAAALPANTYANGALGVGATLTATGNGALTVDGVTVSVADRVVVAHETASENNGIYTVTATGDAGNPYVLTRATDMDQAAEFPSAMVPVSEGSTNFGTLFFAGPAIPVVVGTTPVPWTELSIGSGFAPLNSPHFTGIPTAPTPAPGDSSTQIATSAFVVNSPAFLGVPTAPTAATPTNTTQIATTAFVKNQAYAPLASPAFTGNPTAPSVIGNSNDGTLATTRFVHARNYVSSTISIPHLRVSTALNQIETHVYVESWDGNPEFGGEGTFTVNPYDLTSADNSGTIIVDASSRRWYRQRTTDEGLNVRWFGAHGDGVTDDTLAIRQAAAAIGAAGGTIHFPAGTYAVSGGVMLKSNTTVQGVGQQSLIKALPTMTISDGVNFSLGTFFYNQNGQFNGNTIIDHDITIRDIAFDGSDGPPAGDPTLQAIRLGQVRRTKVMHCHFETVGDAVAHIGCDTTLVDGCVAYHVNNAAWDHWAGPLNAKVANCHATGIGAASYGALFNAQDTGDTAAFFGSGFTVIGCSFQDFGQAAIYVAPLGTAFSNACYAANIQGNTIDGSGIAAGDGIIISGPGGDHIITGNIITNLASGIAIATLPATPGFLGTAPPAECIVANNLITSCAVPGGSVAVIETYSPRTNIQGNLIYGDAGPDSIYCTGSSNIVSFNNAFTWPTWVPATESTVATVDSTGSAWINNVRLVNSSVSAIAGMDLALAPGPGMRLDMGMGIYGSRGASAGNAEIKIAGTLYRFPIYNPA